MPLIDSNGVANKEKGNKEATGSDYCEGSVNDTQFKHCGLPSPTLYRV